MYVCSRKEGKASPLESFLSRQCNSILRLTCSTTTMLLLLCSAPPTATLANSSGISLVNSWHRKCGFIWQSPQEHQNQILNASLYLNSSARLKPTSSPLHSRPTLEAVNHWSPILSFSNVGLTEAGPSLLSLLSASSSISPNEVLFSASHASGCAARSEVSLLSSGPFPQNLGTLHAQAGLDLVWRV